MIFLLIYPRRRSLTEVIVLHSSPCIQITTSLWCDVEGTSLGYLWYHIYLLM